MYQLNTYTRASAVGYGNKQNRQSPALTQPLPEFTPPVGARGQDIMIIWDMQNVRIPSELEPVDVIRFLYNTFVMQPGPRRCAGAFCTFTDNTKKAVGEKRFNQFCSNGVLNFMMINSPGGPRKADDSDHPLKEMMMNFTVDCVRGHKDGVLLLITADADFVRPAIWCKQQGCVSLELLYYGPIASKEIKQLEATWKMEWRDFLDCSIGRRCAWTFPYPQDIAAGLVPDPHAGSSSSGNHYGSSPQGTYTSGRTSLDRQQQQHHHHLQQQQQHPTITGFLPAPQRRLLLPDPARAAAASNATAAAAQPAAGVVQVRNTHVQQAAAQLLHNPAALHQVVQQYKQSMQTTAVLQQVLQGVAQAATARSGVAATAAAAGAAAGSAAVANMGAAAAAPQQQQRGSAGTTPVKLKPVQLHTRPCSATAAAVKPPSGAAAAAAAGSSPGLTWQQLEQQQNGSATAAASRVSAPGFIGDNAAAAVGGYRSRSPPLPQWFDSPLDGSSSSASKAPRQLQHSRSAGAALAAGGSSTSSSNWDRKPSTYKPDGWAENENDDGFWDVSNAVTKVGHNAAAAAAATAAGASAADGGLPYHSNSNSMSTTPVKLFGAGGSSSSSGDATKAAAAGAALPPTPSMGLLKRAGGPGSCGTLAAAAAGNGPAGSSSSGIGFNGALTALLAGAAAKGSAAAGSSSSMATEVHQHKHHHHSNSNGALNSGSSGQAVLQQMQWQQQQPPVRLLARSQSPGLQDNQQEQQQQQQDDWLFDKHQQHHELQLAMMQRQKLAEQQQQAAAAGAAASTPQQQQQQVEEGEDDGMDELERALLQRKRMAAAAAAATSGQQQHTADLSGETAQPGSSSDSSSSSGIDSKGTPCRPKRALGPELVAAARLLQKATSAAVADLAGNSAVGQQQQQQHGQLSNSGGVVVLEAPPPPVWMLPQQQQQQHASVGPGSFLHHQQHYGQQQQQQREELGSVTAAMLQDQQQQQQPDEPGFVRAELVPDQEEHQPYNAQQQQQQQQAEEPGYLIDEETGEVIILKPKTSSAVTSNVRERSTGCSTPAGLAAAAAATVAPSSSEGVAAPSVAACMPVITTTRVDHDTLGVAGSQCSPTAAAAAAGEDVCDQQLTGTRSDTCDQRHATDTASNAAAAAAAADVDKQVVDADTRICVDLRVADTTNRQQQPQDEKDTQQQQQQLVELQLSVETSSEMHADSAAPGEHDDVVTTANDNAAVGTGTDAALLREVSAAAAAALAAAALAASPTELLNELEQQQQHYGSDQQSDDAVGFEQLDLDGNPLHRSRSFSHRSVSINSRSGFKTGSPDQGSADSSEAEGLATPGGHQGFAEGPGAVLSPRICNAGGSDPFSMHVSTGFVAAPCPVCDDFASDDYVATLVRRISGGVADNPAVAATVNSDQPQQDASTDGSTPLDSPMYGLESLDLHGQPVSITSPRFATHQITPTISDPLDLHTTLASVGFSAGGLGIPADLDLNVGVLPIPIPLNEPTGFSGPSVGPLGGFSTAGNGAGHGLRAASPVTAIEELGNASSSSSAEDSSGSSASNSRGPSDDGAGLGHFSEDGSVRNESSPDTNAETTAAESAVDDEAAAAPLPGR